MSMIRTGIGFFRSKNHFLELNILSKKHRIVFNSGHLNRRLPLLCNRSLSTNSTEKKSNGFVSSLYGPESNFANESFKARWFMALPAFATHMCIGFTPKLCNKKSC